MGLVSARMNSACLATINREGLVEFTGILTQEMGSSPESFSLGGEGGKKRDGCEGVHTLSLKDNFN